MRISIAKGKTADRLDIERTDGSALSSDFSHKGPIPHDAVHYFVERGLGIADGFWGMVARGRHPEEIGAMAKAAGHASAARRRTPDADFVAAIQAERLVECFEADLWGGGSDAASFIAAADAGCTHSLVPPVPLTAERIAAIRADIAAFASEWEALPVGESIELEWNLDAASTR